MYSRKEKESNFIVQMYEPEYRQIQAWVDKHQHAETGGDLFGLWADDQTALVQLVLGPGTNCRRTGASFYQDVDYLERVGNILTNEEGLCHIGEWHSHHRIGLKEPSGGDENTVWTNMERYGINRFFLFMATIEGGYYRHRRGVKNWSLCDVEVRCFPFKIDSTTRKRKPVLQGKIKFMSDERQESPFRLKTELAKVLEDGAESKNSWEDMKKFEMKGRESEETTRNKNKKGSIKGKDDSSTRPQNKRQTKKTESHREICNTNETLVDEEVQESKKTFISKVYIELSNQKKLRKSNEERGSQEKKTSGIDSTNDDQDHSSSQVDTKTNNFKNQFRETNGQKYAQGIEDTQYSKNKSRTRQKGRRNTRGTNKK